MTQLADRELIAAGTVGALIVLVVYPIIILIPGWIIRAGMWRCSISPSTILIGYSTITSGLIAAIPSFAESPEVWLLILFLALLAVVAATWVKREGKWSDRIGDTLLTIMGILLTMLFLLTLISELDVWSLFTEGAISNETKGEAGRRLLILMAVWLGNGLIAAVKRERIKERVGLTLVLVSCILFTARAVSSDQVLSSISEEIVLASKLGYDSPQDIVVSVNCLHLEHLGFRLEDRDDKCLIFSAFLRLRTQSLSVLTRTSTDAPIVLYGDIIDSRRSARAAE